MKAIRLFFRRLYWSLMFSRSDKTKLVELLKTPDKDVCDLLWKAYIRQVCSIPELMLIVYDDSHEFDRATRVVAGETVLMLLKQPLGCLFLPGSAWTSTENGRLAYLVGVGLYLPELRRRASFIAEDHFYPHERRVFAGAWQ